MVPLIVLIVVLAVGGAIALLVKSKKAAAASEEAGTGPNEFLQSPPTSFPASSGSTRSLEAVSDSSPAAADPSPTVVGTPVTDEAEQDDEVIVARFKAPGARSMGSNGSAKPVVVPPAYHLEGPPAMAEPEAETEPEPGSAPVDEPVAPVLALVPDAPDAESGPEALSESEPEAESESESEADPESVVVGVDGPVIDLSDAQAVVMPADADAVDHVLLALINRARFEQVEVEAVATELVERADLQGQEVSDVLAELVGRADDSTLDAARTSELTLFNDEVPSRPGQLTDFARLAPTEKKRIIVRVLCLLVARSEDQQLPPRAEGESAEPRAWPLARAVWPLATSDDDGEAQLPNRRLAKSG